MRQTKEEQRNCDNFIMLPTVDFCFKELMQNPKVRKGFIAALLGESPDEIKETSLLPTILERESQENKLGILDVRILMENGTQMDMEMQVLYFEYWTQRILFYLSKLFSGQLKKGESYGKLKKCIHVSILNFDHFQDDGECYRVIQFCDRKTGKPYTELMEIQFLELGKLSKTLTDEEKSGDKVIQWMRFLNGRSKKEFEDMDKKDEYLNEAYNTLLTLSADEQKRLKYEAREKALKDYNTQMESAEERGRKLGEEIGEERGRRLGEKIGEARGEKRGEARVKQIFLLEREGKSYEEIAEICEVAVEKVREILE